MANDAGSAAAPLALSSAHRRLLIEQTADLIERHYETLPDRPVAPEVSPQRVRQHVRRYEFTSANDPAAVVDDVARMLGDWTVHVTHPRYFGLFNPTPAWMGVLGETLAAAYNPQLAAWSHAAAANEIERHVVSFIGERVGFPRGDVAGSFTTGGAEANLTGTLLALVRRIPEVADDGVRAAAGQPVLYASEESHLAWIKIARVCGLGSNAVRLVPVDARLRMDLGALQDAVEADRRAGNVPFLLIGTAGTTGAGIIDPLPELAAVAAERELSFHVDAAWAGAAVLSEAGRAFLDGIERADSVTIDPHKWMSAPMGAGIFLCTDLDGLHRTFDVATRYMPPALGETIDPYTHSIQWSRRFIGLKVFMALATLGVDGYARQIDRDCELGDELRSSLGADGWRVVNDTPLPVVCFAEPAATDAFHRAVVDDVVGSGAAWISPVQLGDTVAIRACITSHRTTSEDVQALRAALAAARERVHG